MTSLCPFLPFFNIKILIFMKKDEFSPHRKIDTPEILSISAIILKSKKEYVMLVLNTSLLVPRELNRVCPTPRLEATQPRFWTLQLELEGNHVILFTN